MWGNWSFVFPGVCAFLTLPVPAQVLVIALRSVAEVAAFSPHTRFFSLALLFLGCACGVAFSLRMPILRLSHRPRLLALGVFSLRTSLLVVPAGV